MRNPDAPDGASARVRLTAILRLLLARAMRDGNLGRARRLLNDYGSFLDADESAGYRLRIDETAAWCPQNDAAADG